MLRAQMADKEAELGRPLTREEAEEWLKQLGSPIQVAGRYQRQQYLIGPTVFPTYWYVLRLSLTWCAIVYAIAKAVDIASRGLSADAIVHAAAVPGNADDRRVRRFDRLGRKKISGYGQAGPAFKDELLARVAGELAHL